MQKEWQERIEVMQGKLNDKLEGALIEEVISLFNSGVLTLSQTFPRSYLEEIRGDYNLTVSQNQRVDFTGKEKIIELEKKVSDLQDEIEQLGYEHLNEIERMDL